jgi:hypothetical protein
MYCLVITDFFSSIFLFAYKKRLQELENTLTEELKKLDAGSA